MVSIPSEFHDLFEKPILFALATVMSDGQPQVTPVWGDMVDGQPRINTAVGRQKDRNLKERPMATVMLVDPENPQRWIEVRGTVTGTTEGADAVIDGLAKKYLGVDSYPYRSPTETRITFTITPTKVTHS
ncbi:MAG TPA: PPOX class F420-dependent oxidoreductase [Thermomicrobiales bacterium]|jgi:PPOX class probable F420-dependent enzyme|nr:PPOX class F420-dependent oxidoreductase [Thermomicrobiales bacterium]